MAASTSLSQQHEINSARRNKFRTPRRTWWDALRKPARTTRRCANCWRSMTSRSTSIPTPQPSPRHERRETEDIGGIVPAEPLRGLLRGVLAAGLRLWLPPGESLGPAGATESSSAHASAKHRPFDSSPATGSPPRIALAGLAASRQDQCRRKADRPGFQYPVEP